MAQAVRGKALVAKLRGQAGVRDPEALAAYLGRFKKARKAGKSVAAAKDVAKGADVAKKATSLKPSTESSKSKRITAADVDAKPWTFSPQQYQIAKGVEQPHIGEISGMQYQGLGKRGKKAYDEKRNKEWQASADIKTEWRDKVARAYEKGEINKDTPGLHKEARSTMIHHDIAREKRDKENKERAANEAATVRSLDDIEKGQELQHTIYGPVRVIRKSAKSVRVVALDRNGNANKNRDGSDSTLNISVKHFNAGMLKRKKK